MKSKLDTKLYCPVCKKERLLNAGKVLFRRGNSLVIYNECLHCLSSFIAVVSKDVQGLVAIETLTDLSYEEAIKLIGKKPLAINNVLDIYQRVH